MNSFVYLLVNVVIWLYPKNAPVIAKIQNPLIKPLKSSGLN
jgi:hypothetical protein